MQRSHETFQVSPEDFFVEIDRAFVETRARLADLATRVDALGDLGTELARSSRPAPGAAPPPTRWCYDAVLPNLLFADVFAPEPVAGGAKRWVGRGGRLAATLRLPRHVQYDIEIDIVDFASDALAQSFFLRIDGMQYPWLSHADGRYASLALEIADPALADIAALDIEIGVDPSLIPSARDVSFAFRHLAINRRG